MSKEPMTYRAGESRAAPADQRPLRVLMVVESCAGGTGRHVLDLAERLIAAGHDVHLLYSTGRIGRFFLQRLPRIAGLKRSVVPMRTGIHPSDFTAVRAIRRYLREHGPFDIVHGHSSKGGALARLAAIGTGVPAFYTLHGIIMIDPSLPRWKRRFYQAVEIALSVRTSRIIAVSPEEAEAAVRCGFGRSRVTLIPNGVGDAVLASRLEARRAMGVSDDALVIGSVGRLVEQKAPDLLIRAMASVSQALPLARLALVGDGPLETDLRHLAADLRVSNRIIWLGERDPGEVLGGFDLFAIASRKEGLPYAVLEAMSAGLPIVAASSAGVGILVEDGISGAVVPPNDPTALAEALIRLGSSPGALARCATASRRRAGHFTVDTMVDRTLAAYFSVLKSLDALPDPDAAELVTPA